MLGMMTTDVIKSNRQDAEGRQGK